MKVLMTGGGTGGHINPAIAIAETIKKHHPDAVIEFVSSTLQRDKANDLVPRAGYKLHKLDICGSYPIWDPRNLKTLYYMAKSNKQAKALIKEFCPDVIIGTGGFACYPVLNAGAEMGIPTLVHESNAIAGKAVKRLAPRVDCVMTNFRETAEELKGAKRVIRVGNPTVFDLDAIIEKSKNETNGKKNKLEILSFGGSGGSEPFNDMIASTLASLSSIMSDVHFYHATGQRDHERMMNEYKRLGLDKIEGVEFVEYIYDMHERMANADIIICRAGAMTLSELALLGKAAILVPSPYVVYNHQYKNAKAIYDKGACELVVEEKNKDYTSGNPDLTDAIKALVTDTEKRAELAERIKDFADADANEKIYLEIKNLMHI